MRSCSYTVANLVVNEFRTNTVQFLLFQRPLVKKYFRFVLKASYAISSPNFTYDLS